MFQFQCGRCENTISVPDSYRGSRIRCPKCSGVLLVPPNPENAGYDLEGPSTFRSAPGSEGSKGSKKVTRRREPSAGDWVDAVRASKGSVVISLLIAAFGGFWLLSELDLLPALDWLWTFCLAGTGVMTLVLGGINKQTVVVGPFLIVCAGFSILRQTGMIEVSHEIPCLMIAFGFQLFLVTVFGYSLPDLLRDD